MAPSLNLTAIASAKDTYPYLEAGIAASCALDHLSEPNRSLESLRKLGTTVRRVSGTNLLEFEFGQGDLCVREFGHLGLDGGHFSHYG